MSVILATLEGEIRRIFVSGHVLNPISTNKLGMVVCTYDPSYVGRSRPCLGQPLAQRKPCLKNNAKKGCEVCMAQVVECLSTKCEADFKPQYCQKKNLFPLICYKQ
jgi:hypothetical protein